MQVYFTLDREFEKWYESLPPRGRSQALNDILRRGFDKVESLVATKSDIARLETLIKNLRVVQAQPQEEEYIIPSMGIEEEF